MAHNPVTGVSIYDEKQAEAWENAVETWKEVQGNDLNDSSKGDILADISRHYVRNATVSTGDTATGRTRLSDLKTALWWLVAGLMGVAFAVGSIVGLGYLIMYLL